MDYMQEISINNLNIYNLDDSNYMLQFGFTTKTTTTALIDLSKKSSNEIKIISSEQTYNGFKSYTPLYTNKNTGAIKFYSYAGGKELSRLINGSNQLSNIAYPNFNGSLFSSIVFPEINDNDTVYLLIDKYNELKSISCPLVKQSLINEDLIIMLDSIENQIKNKQNIKVTILFDKKTCDELIKHESYINSIINHYKFNVFNSDNICQYTCDLVFGKIFGGQTNEYNGIINLKGFTIIDAFLSNYGYPTSHTLINRTVGLSISGNGQAEMTMIVKLNDLTDRLIINEVISDTELINIELKGKQHKNTNEMLQFIKLIDQTANLKKIIKKNDKNEMKKFMKDTMEETYNWEFNFLSSYDPNNLYENIKDIMNDKIMSLYSNLIDQFGLIRSIFTENKKQKYGKRNQDYEPVQSVMPMKKPEKIPFGFPLFGKPVEKDNFGFGGCELDDYERLTSFVPMDLSRSIKN